MALPNERPPGYPRLLSDVKTFLEMEEVWGKRALNQIKVQIYWKIGERIYREILGEGERADYGSYLLKLLSQDLAITLSHLSTIVSFYKCYPFPQHISNDLTWSHYRKLIVIGDNRARRYYEVQAIINRWSVRQLEESITRHEYDIAQKSGLALPSLPPIIPDKESIFKASYEFPFLEINRQLSEEELERGLINHMEKFLLELGYGFAFLGSQRKVLIGGQSHRIDLLFFHTLLCCHVIVELKIEPFRDTFVGQMNKYLNYFRERENLPYMRDPIGLIICKDRNREEIHYALGGLEEKIFVAQYRLCLPSEEQIAEELRRIPWKDNANLSQREKRTLKDLAAHEVFSAHQYREIAGISIATAKRDLKRLVESGILEKNGQGRSRVYRIAVGMCGDLEPGPE